MSDFAKFILYLTLILFILFLASIRPARADDYLTLTCCSWHARNHEFGNKDTHYQETNHGIGYEHEFSPSLSLSVGEYSNSIYNHTDYLGVLWYPAHYGNFKFGFFGGGVTGYTNGVEPIAIPTITYETPSWGINLEALALPPVTRHLDDLDRHDSIFAIQFKIGIP